jgi:hypothetical protein
MFVRASASQDHPVEAGPVRQPQGLRSLNLRVRPGFRGPAAASGTQNEKEKEASPPGGGRPPYFPPASPDHPKLSRRGSMSRRRPPRPERPGR